MQDISNKVTSKGPLRSNGLDVGLCHQHFETLSPDAVPMRSRNVIGSVVVDTTAGQDRGHYGIETCKDKDDLDAVQWVNKNAEGVDILIKVKISVLGSGCEQILIQYLLCVLCKSKLLSFCA